MPKSEAVIVESRCWNAEYLEYRWILRLGSFVVEVPEEHASGTLDDRLAKARVVLLAACNDEETPYAEATR